MIRNNDNQVVALKIFIPSFAHYQTKWYKEWREILGFTPYGEPLDSPINSVWVLDIWYFLKKEIKLNIQIRLYF